MEKRFEINSGLQGETLVRKGLHRKRAAGEQIRITPDLNVIKIGGHAAIDYGREVMYPLVEELGRLSKEHQMLIVTGGGGRVRHIMDVGMDLGMPTGVLAELSAKISEQNAIMVSILLSKYNGVRIHTGDLLNSPAFSSSGCFRLCMAPPRTGSMNILPNPGQSPRTAPTPAHS